VSIPVPVSTIKKRKREREWGGKKNGKKHALKGKVSLRQPTDLANCAKAQNWIYKQLSLNNK